MHTTQTTTKPATPNTAATYTASQAQSRFGSPEPQIEIRMPAGTNHRALKAALHRLAAAVEEATPAREGWIVQIDTLTDVRGRVYLELLDGTPAEAARGLELLRKVAG